MSDKLRMYQGPWLWMFVFFVGCGWLWWTSGFYRKTEVFSQTDEAKERIAHPSILEVDFRKDMEIPKEEENAQQLRVRDLGAAEGEDRLERLESPMVLGTVPPGWRVEADAEEFVELEHAKIRVRSPIYRLSVDPKAGSLFFREPGVTDGMGAGPLLLADAAMLHSHAKRWEWILTQMREVMPDVALAFQSKTEGQEEGDEKSRRNRPERNH